MVTTVTSDVVFPVLDHGCVKVIGIDGDDERCVNSARISYGEGTKIRNDSRGLIRYLLRHGHMSVFESSTITLAITLPIFVARQLMRHSFSVNEISARYSVMSAEFYYPESLNIQSVDNMQGRDKDINSRSASYLEIMKSRDRESYAFSLEMLDSGVSREQARAHLPVNLYTSIYMTINLRTMLFLIKNRLSDGAQYEIQEYAKVFANIVHSSFPLVYEAFEDYLLHSVSLSKHEFCILSDCIDKDKMRSLLLSMDSMGKREKREFSERFGL